MRGPIAGDDARRGSPSTSTDHYFGDSAARLATAIAPFMSAHFRQVLVAVVLFA